MANLTLLVFFVAALTAPTIANPTTTSTPVEPVNSGPAVGSNVDAQPIFDVDALVDVAIQMQYNLDNLVQLLEELAYNVSASNPHVIHKRQTSISGNVDRSQGGPTANINLSHRNGGTTYTGNVNYGPRGTGYGAGVSHSTSGGWNFGGNYNRPAGGSGSGRINFGRSWNNGRTSVGGYFGRSGGGGGNSGGISFTHRFRK